MRREGIVHAKATLFVGNSSSIAILQCQSTIAKVNCGLQAQQTIAVSEQRVYFQMLSQLTESTIEKVSCGLQEQQTISISRQQCVYCQMLSQLRAIQYSKSML